MSWHQGVVVHLVLPFRQGGTHIGVVGVGDVHMAGEDAVQGVVPVGGVACENAVHGLALNVLGNGSTEVLQQSGHPVHDLDNGFPVLPGDPISGVPDE